MNGTALARIGVGSNLGDPETQVRRALAALRRVGTVVGQSTLYRTAPWGLLDQPSFVNAAALVETSLGPHALLGALKALERDLGRVDGPRWGPRAIDLDILAYGDLVVRESDLTLPHARLFERAFALGPLADIDARYRAAFDALPAAERATVQRIPAEAARTETAVNWDETLERVRSTAEFCASAGLTRCRIEEEALAIEVRRTPRATEAAEFAEVAEGVPVSNGAASNGSVAYEEPAATILRAEFVGIVRFSRPAVAEGSVLPEDREVAYVESLGIRNPVRSGRGGRIAGVFVADGEPVEYGQPLFSID